MSWGTKAQNMGWGTIEEGWKKGPWTAQEDRLLIEYVKLNGEGRWNNVAKITGLKRNGKSCRLRWVNYLRPDLKKGQITPHEENIIHELHAKWGNRWSTIARSLPGRTDNEIKNYWRTHYKKKEKTSSDGRRMTWARLLKKQQFHLQQQQEEEEERQRDHTDMKKLVPLLHDQSGNRFSSFTQFRPEITYPSGGDAEGCLYSLINGCGGSMAESLSEDIVTWNGLWNLDDDLYGNMRSTGINCYQSLATNFC